MKKLLLLALLTLSFSANAGTVLKYETKCINGYLFAVVMARKNTNEPVSVSMVQIFERTSRDYISDLSKPMKCK